MLHSQSTLSDLTFSRRSSFSSLSDLSMGEDDSKHGGGEKLPQTFQQDNASTKTSKSQGQNDDCPTFSSHISNFFRAAGRFFAVSFFFKGALSRAV